MGNEQGRPVAASGPQNASTTTANTAPKGRNAPRRQPSIQQRDRQIRKRIRGGITYQMKIVICGERGVGKTSLLQRLQGKPIPLDHVRTREIQTAKISWNFQQVEENVNIDIWDCVDEGIPLECAEEGGVQGENPSGQTGSNVEQSGANPQKMLADATNVDIFSGTHCAVFLMDITKINTLEYVRTKLEKVPVHIPTVVVGNFRDLGNQRKVFKEDIHETLYGTEHVKIGSRPKYLQYFECSLLNCYGLNVLHQYINIPFLHLRQQTLRQQLKLVENDLSKSNYDLQVSISDQRYSDFVTFLDQSDCDIRTGRVRRKSKEERKLSARDIELEKQNSGPVLESTQESEAGSHEPECSEEQTNKSQDMSPETDTLTDTKVSHVEENPPQPVEKNVENSSSTVINGSENPSVGTTRASIPTHFDPGMDAEDLPTRRESSTRRQSSLKIEYSRKEKLQHQNSANISEVEITPPSENMEKGNEKEVVSDNSRMPPLPLPSDKPKPKSGKPSKDAKDAKDGRFSALQSIEDFKVTSNLEDFYASDDDSIDGREEGMDVDVVVDATSRSNFERVRKPGFIYSDDEDSEHEKKCKKEEERKEVVKREALKLALDPLRKFDCDVSSGEDTTAEKVQSLDTYAVVDEESEEDEVCGKDEYSENEKNETTETQNIAGRNADRHESKIVSSQETLDPAQIVDESGEESAKKVREDEERDPSEYYSTEDIGREVNSVCDESKETSLGQSIKDRNELEGGAYLIEKDECEVNSLDDVAEKRRAESEDLEEFEVRLNTASPVQVPNLDVREEQVVDESEVKDLQGDVHEDDKDDSFDFSYSTSKQDEMDNFLDSLSSEEDEMNLKSDRSEDVSKPLANEKVASPRVARDFRYGEDKEDKENGSRASSASNQLSDNALAAIEAAKKAALSMTIEKPRKSNKSTKSRDFSDKDSEKRKKKKKSKKSASSEQKKDRTSGSRSRSKQSIQS